MTVPACPNSTILQPVSSCHATAFSLNTVPISEMVVPITQLDTKIWENRVQVEKYWSYPLNDASNPFVCCIIIFTGLLQDSPIVRLGMEDRILMVAEDHRSPMQGVCLTFIILPFHVTLHIPVSPKLMSRAGQAGYIVYGEEEKTHIEKYCYCWERHN